MSRVPSPVVVAVAVVVVVAVAVADGDHSGHGHVFVHDILWPSRDWALARRLLIVDARNALLLEVGHVA
jgi:hypothetical protein